MNPTITGRKNMVSIVSNRKFMGCLEPGGKFFVMLWYRKAEFAIVSNNP